MLHRNEFFFYSIQIISKAYEINLAIVVYSTSLSSSLHFVMFCSFLYSNRYATLTIPTTFYGCAFKSGVLQSNGTLGVLLETFLGLFVTITDSYLSVTIWTVLFSEFVHVFVLLLEVDTWASSNIIFFIEILDRFVPLTTVASFGTNEIVPEHIAFPKIFFKDPGWILYVNFTRISWVIQMF